MPGLLSVYDQSRFGWVRPDGSVLAVDPPPDTFILGETRPVPGVNVGNIPGVTLTPYTGPSTNNVLTVSKPTTFENIDFGTIRINRQTNDLVFINCKWLNTGVDTASAGLGGPMVDCRGGSTFGGTYLYRCSFDNASQWSPGYGAVQGYGFVMERCHGQNYSDITGSFVPSSRIDGRVDVELLGCYLGPLAFWWAPTSGAVHPSDTKTHNDNHQHQGGRGLKVIGCEIPARYSTTIGTGTPNSGNDTGGIGTGPAPYTQAAGVAKRFEIVEGSGLYSAGQPGAFLGGSIAGLMYTGARGSTPDTVVEKNWGGGGAYWLNCGGGTHVTTGLETGYSFGIVTGNRIDRDQRTKDYAFGIVSNLTALVTDNVWTNGSGTIPRKNA